MSAKIILLDNYRKSTIRCPINGVIFPQLYRRTGRFWDFKDEARTELIPGSFPSLEYVLAPNVGDDVADPVCEPIGRLDPDIDSGWVIIRHHKNADRLTGYIEAHSDLGQRKNFSRMVWETQDGFFSVLCRAPIAGCPDHLLIFSTAIPHPTVSEENWTQVIDSSGAEHDEEILDPPGHS